MTLYNFQEFSYKPEILPQDFVPQAVVKDEVAKSMPDIKVFPLQPSAPVVDVPMADFSLIDKNLMNFMESVYEHFTNMMPKVISFPGASPIEPIVLQPGNDYKLPADAEASFEKFMDYVLADEGGFVNNSKDPGGATNLGIRKDLYEKIMGPISLEDFKKLTKAQAKEYYYKYYWLPSGAKDIADSGNEQLAYTLLDTAIHHGTYRAKSLLKKSNGDANKLIDARLALLKKSKNWGTFGRGWTARLNRIEARISNMDSRPNMNYNA